MEKRIHQGKVKNKPDPIKRIALVDDMIVFYEDKIMMESSMKLEVGKEYSDLKGNIFLCLIIGKFNAVCLQMSGFEKGHYNTYSLNGEDESDFYQHLVKEA